MSANTMFCERCGSGVPAGASTCPNCGAPVGASAYETRKVDAGWSQVEVPQPGELQQPAYEPTVKVPEISTPEPVPPVFTPPPPVATSLPEAPKRSRTWKIVAGCVGAILVCLCMAVVSVIVAGIVVGGLSGW